MDRSARCARGGRRSSTHEVDARAPPGLIEPRQEGPIWLAASVSPEAAQIETTPPASSNAPTSSGPLPTSSPPTASIAIPKPIGPKSGATTRSG